MLNHQGLVNAVDTSLQFVSDMSYTSNRPVYEVSRNGSLYVFKAVSTRNPSGMRDLNTERRVLEISSNVAEITHMIAFYGIPGYRAILKQYAAGQDLLRRGGKLADSNLQERIEQTVRQMHEAGVAGLDLRPENLVVADDKSNVTLIEPGDCLLRMGSSDYNFNLVKKEDWIQLESLFK